MIFGCYFWHILTMILETIEHVQALFLEDRHHLKHVVWLILALANQD